MRFLVGIDVGGTFTDLVMAEEEEGVIRLFKAATTPEALAEGVLHGLEGAAERYGMPLPKLLASIGPFTHGTTIATNAVITGNLAKTGLILTDGFRDILLMRMGGRPPGTHFQAHIANPKPYVPRYLTLTVKGRIGAEGEETIPLDEEEVRKAIRQFQEWKVEAIAVCLLWSHKNPVHEKRVGEIIRAEWPEATYSLSCEVSPLIREYYRASTTAIDASLKSFVSRYVLTLEDRLKTSGYEGKVMLVNSGGGVMSPEEMSQSPIYAIKSGPSMGCVAGLKIVQDEGLGNHVMVSDMGGTSFDVSLVTDGIPHTTLTSQVGDTHYSLPCVDVVSIGAGGGSIAWVDPGGLTHVGPRSAQAVPGPACYMSGGTEPTVTDANVVLNYLNPAYFLGGRMKIEPRLSEKVIQEKIADRLGIGTAEAAALIVNTVNFNMLGAIEEVSVMRGIHPRDYVMVVGGGAGPLHIAALVRELGIQQTIVPRLAAGMCAYAMLVSDIRVERGRSLFSRAGKFDYPEVNHVLEGLEKEIVGFMDRVGVPREKQRVEFSVSARYYQEVWELRVRFPWKRITPEVLPQLVEIVHQAHEQAYTYRQDEVEAEFVSWLASGIGLQPKFEFPDQPYRGEDATPALKGKRKAYFAESRDFVETPIYAGERLGFGNKIRGPAIIEEATTTVLIPPDFMATVTKKGNYLLEQVKL